VPVAGESISGLILFIAAMLIAASVAGTLVVNVTEISGSIETHSDDLTDRIDTDIAILSDPGSDAIYNDSEAELTLLVKNTGAQRLPADGTNLDVLVDGEYVSVGAANITIIDGQSWQTGSVARIVIDANLDAGEHRVIVEARGNREVLEFYHE
jgi:flagellar protein FlaG